MNRDKENAIIRMGNAIMALYNSSKGRCSPMEMAEVAYDASGFDDLINTKSKDEP